MEPLYVDWTTIKNFTVTRNLSLQWVICDNTYRLKCFDNFFSMDCSIPMDGNTDQIDFETNFKNKSNKPIKTEVITQFEKEDKILKLFSGEVDVVNGVATLLLKTPGVPGSGGRYIDWGVAWFNEQHNGDKVYKVEVVDIDNLLGYGAGVILRTYHDEAALEENCGWRIPKTEGVVEVDALGGYGFLPSGFYLRIIGKKGESQQTGTFYVNLKWGKDEV